MTYLDPGELDEFNKYRLSLAKKSELDYQQALKDARDASLQKIESMWNNLGDVGMVKDLMDTFANSFAYSIENISADDVWKRVSRTGETFNDAKNGIASKEAWGDVGFQALLEFSKHIEAINKIMGIVTTAFEELGPIASDFLQPLIPILGILIGMLNVFVPILTIIMPLMQVLATAIIMVIEPFQTIAAVIQYAIGKITFWTKSDDIAWSEVQNIHSDNLQTIENIWNMEIDARASYVSDLTDAQQGEIDAYKEMYESGLLDLSQYLSLRNNVTGTNQTSEVQAFAEGGDFITNGPRMIMVGDNAGGREHVVIEPLSSSNSYASLGNAKSIARNGNTYAPTFYITSNNPKEVARSVEDLLATMSRRGESYAS